MKASRGGMIAGALALALALPLPALAQGAGPPAQDQGPGYGPGMMRGYGGYGPGMMGSGGRGGYGPGMMWGRNGRFDSATAANFAEGQLAFLKAELKITPQQESLWNAYADAVRANAKAMYQQHRALFDREPADETLPQRLDRREQLMTLGLESMRKTDSALKPLYAALDKDQKQRADEFAGIGMGPMTMPFAGRF